MLPLGLTLMAIHAHPDDEVIFGGGTLARYAAMGHTIVVVTCTNGDKGRIADPRLVVPPTRACLGAVRLAELRRAVQALGVTHAHALGYADSGRTSSPRAADPHALINADPDEVTMRLVGLMRRHRPHVVITYDEQGSYGHPDHILVHHAALAAVRASADPLFHPHLGYPWKPLKGYYCSAHLTSDLHALWQSLTRRGISPVFGDLDPRSPPLWGVDDAWPSARIDVRPYIAHKVAALRAHRTQIRRDSSLLSLPDDLARAYLGREGFRLAWTTLPVADAEEDLFSGIRTWSMRESTADHAEAFPSAM